MAATDGVRLAVASMMVGQTLEKEVEVIIPNKAVRELGGVTLSSDMVRIGIQEKGINSSQEPIVIRPAAGDYLCVLMPVRA